MIIHGFTSNARPGSGCEFLKDAYLRVADVNVILVDWSGVDTGIYILDVNNVVPMVGAEIASLVKALVAHRGAREDDFHIIGHSLGAQIAGAAGSIALGPTGKGWVTGLDPAGPMFEGQDASHRIDDSDAGFVDAVHTDGGFLGIVQPVGHVDYYVNGGMHRHPDCGPDVFGLCTHCFAFEVMARAVSNKGSIVGTKCDPTSLQQGGACQRDGEKVVLGTRLNDRSHGTYYVDTAGVLKPSGVLQDIGRGLGRSIFSSFIGKLTQPRNAATRLVRC